MTTTDPSQPPSAIQWSRRRWLWVSALGCLLSFSLGFWVSDRRLDERALESGRRQVEEFVVFCDRLGVLDRARLEEALITASESEWEDKDAADQTEGGQR